MCEKCDKIRALETEEDVKKAVEVIELEVNKIQNDLRIRYPESANTMLAACIAILVDYDNRINASIKTLFSDLIQSYFDGAVRTMIERRTGVKHDQIIH